VSLSPDARNSDLPAMTETAQLENRRQWTTGRRTWRMLFALFAIEIGLLLAVYPWMDAWNLNHLPAYLETRFGLGFGSSLEDFWDDPYFRGAVTGLGLVNVWVGLREVANAFFGRSSRSNSINS
jgi:hypothetical protein